MYSVSNLLIVSLLFAVSSTGCCEAQTLADIVESMNRPSSKPLLSKSGGLEQATKSAGHLVISVRSGSPSQQTLTLPALYAQSPNWMFRPTSSRAASTSVLT